MLAETIDLSNATASLTSSGNVPAIQLLNATPNDPKTLLEFELTAQR